MDRERLDTWLERGILVLVLAVLVFGPLATGATHPWQFLVIQGLTVGVTGLWLAQLWLGKEHRWLWPPVCWAVLAFLGYAVVRYWYADIEYVARQELIRVIVYACLFFVVLNHLHHKNSTQIVVLTLVFLAMAISLYAIYQWTTNSKYIWTMVKPDQYFKRASGTYICPNHLAGFLEMVLPLGLAYLFLGRMGHVTKVLLGYASLMIAAGIAVTISRGGWAATGLSLIVFFGILVRYRRFRIPALIFLVVLGTAGSIFMSQARQSQKRFNELLTTGPTENSRYRLWKPAIEIWKENIWTGAGPAHFDYRFRQYRPVDVQARPERVHNDYLNTLTDWGLIGAGLVAAALVLVYWGVFKSWKYVRHRGNDLGTRQSNKAALVLGGGVGLLAILLHSFVDFNMHIPANAILAITIMALLSNHLRFASDRYWVAGGWIKRSLATLCGLAAIVYLAHEGYFRARERYWLERASQEPVYSRARLDDLLKAFTMEPNNSSNAYEIGEFARVCSWDGGEGYLLLADMARQWFNRAIQLNKYDAYSYLRCGMCLDWMGRQAEADTYFARANQLDPNGYYMVALQGWHLMQKGDYPAANLWFDRSLRLKSTDNPMARSYMQIIRRRLAEGAGAPGVTGTK
ncbi:MAG: O-antigen ligase family protein [Candidatus Omnitrophica bacterium]|nr:O-antigen ligase family protein [Candidatus Omnitrophota bacterium]